MSAAIRALVLVAIAGALIASAVHFQGRAAAPAGSPPPSTSTSADRDSGRLICYGTVDLEQGVASLSTVEPGRVIAVTVAENQHVEAGAELVRVDEAAAQARLAEAEAAVRLAQLQMREAEKQPSLHRIRVEQQIAIRDAMRSRVEAVRRTQEREERLAKSNIITQSDRSISQEKIREAEAMERAEASRLEELEAQDIAGPIERARQELVAAEARRDLARLAVEGRRIRAPGPGTVLRILVAPGDVLGTRPDQPAILFAADGPRVIRATVEQEFAGRVKEGQPATIRDDADPTMSWRGRVGRVAGWYGQRRTIMHDPSQMTDVRTLECLIRLDPDQPALRLGQGVRIALGAVEP